MFDLIKRGRVSATGNRLNLLQSAVPIVADNVAEYLWGDTYSLDDEPSFQTGLEWADFPNLMPPFHNYFVEWLAQTDDLRKVSKWNGVHIVRVNGETSLAPGNVVLRCELFITSTDQHDSFVFGPAITYEIDVAEDGTCRGARIAETFLEGEGDLQTAAFQRLYVCMMQPAFLTTSFMHCRNVCVSEVMPPFKLAKASCRRHGVPLVRFRTINIEPMRKVPRSKGHAHENRIKKALHICRGHFKTYTADKPLFGRVTGTIFVPMHARGSSREGIVIQNYKVQAPTPCDVSSEAA